MHASQLLRIGHCLWEIPQSTRADMRVPAIVFAKDELLPALLKDRSLEQLINVATLPGIQKAALVMPDAHEGYGFPIGGIAATRFPDGVISPGGIGYDINCGVRLLMSSLFLHDVKDKLEWLAKELYAQIPSGTGKGGSLDLGHSTLDHVLKDGASWALQHGFATEKDLEHTESNGCLPNADPTAVSDHAKKRGHDQLGTIGAGNHFVEVDVVHEIFDEEVAATFGLQKNQIVMLIHTGSRGLGHQVATDYLKVMMSAMPRYNIKPPDRELACVPFDSPEGQSYFHAMAAAANFAWCNRQVITYEIRSAWETILGTSGGELSVLYDVAHNIAKVEEHLIDGKLMKLIVHRKGATRAFGPHHEDVPAVFRHIGHPVLIPGSMGTASYVLIGTDKSMSMSFGSTCHGAGRALSRTAARKQVNAAQLKNELRERGIYVEAPFRGIAEEAPLAYKDIDLVVDTVHESGIARKVAKLKPVAVIKG